MTRHYARSKKNERAVDSTPVNTPCSTTILSSVRLNGKTSYTVYYGGTTGERFAEYLKTKLIPTLSKTDVIVMDNMRSHHAKIVKQVLDESEIKYDIVNIGLHFFLKNVRPYAASCSEA